MLSSNLPQLISSDKNQLIPSHPFFISTFKMVNTLSLLALVSGAAATTFTVQVGQGGDTFSPSTVTAAVGDIVTFNFNSLHDVAQSAFGSPCNGATGSDIYSGMMSSVSRLSNI
jgi:plastocyanin